MTPVRSKVDSEIGVDACPPTNRHAVDQSVSLDDSSWVSSVASCQTQGLKQNFQVFDLFGGIIFETASWKSGTAD